MPTMTYFNPPRRHSTAWLKKEGVKLTERRMTVAENVLKNIARYIEDYDELPDVVDVALEIKENWK